MAILIIQLVIFVSVMPSNLLYSMIRYTFNLSTRPIN